MARRAMVLAWLLLAGPTTGLPVESDDPIAIEGYGGIGGIPGPFHTKLKHMSNGGIIDDMDYITAAAAKPTTTRDYMTGGHFPILNDGGGVMEVSVPPRKCESQIRFEVDRLGATSRPCFTSPEPTHTSIFPYDLPPVRLHTVHRNGTNATLANGAHTHANATATATRAATATLPAAGALESLLKALNVNISMQHVPNLPTGDPDFAAAAESIVKLVGGRQMRYLPLEIEVSPGHMGAVWDCIDDLKRLRLKGTDEDLVEIYFAWVKMLNKLIVPPRQPDAVHWSRKIMDKAWHDLYEAYYMARVRSAKMSISKMPRDNRYASGGKLSKSWTLTYTHWMIQGQHLNEVDQLSGHGTNRPGHGLHKKIKECGATTAWHFSYGEDEILDCPEGFVPYGPKKAGQGDPEQIEIAKERKKDKKKHGKEDKEGGQFAQFKRLGNPLLGEMFLGKDAELLTDLGTNIAATEPLPPEQDDEKMSWWTNVGHSGCRPDDEQAAAMGDYSKRYGEIITHKPRVCWEREPHMVQMGVSEKDMPKYMCEGAPYMPQDHIVTRNGTDFLHINFYTWYENAHVRVHQLLRDKRRRDAGEFIATFQLPLAMEHCVKRKLREMGWKTSLHVKNKSNWRVFTFELLSALVLPALPFAAPISAIQGGAVGAAIGNAVSAPNGAKGDRVAVAAGDGYVAAAQDAAAAASAPQGDAAAAVGTNSVEKGAEPSVLTTPEGVATTPVSEELAEEVVAKSVHGSEGGELVDSVHSDPPGEIVTGSRLDAQADALLTKMTLAERARLAAGRAGDVLYWGGDSYGIEALTAAYQTVDELAVDVAES